MLVAADKFVTNSSVDGSVGLHHQDNGTQLLAGLKGRICAVRRRSVQVRIESGGARSRKLIT
jgi:hypothetical protein